MAGQPRPKLGKEKLHHQEKHPNERKNQEKHARTNATKFEQ